MADAEQVDFSYGTYMVFGKPLFFWLRWGGFLIALLEVIVEAQTGPVSIRGTLAPLFWLKVCGAFVYAFLYVKNIPIRVNLAPHRERWLLPQILLGVMLSLDLTNLSVFCIPFCVPVKRRLRWCGIAVICTFAGWIGRMYIFRHQAAPFWNQILHSPARLAVAVVVIGQNYVWYGFAFLGACLLFELAKRQHELAVSNGELITLQAEIKESAKFEERYRLSRELHDAAGHYLTTLGIQLEIAQHRAAEAALPAIARAQLINRVLLAEIRESVSAWREEDIRDLSIALKQMLHDVSGVRTHLEVQGNMTDIPPSIAHGLYRCAQEAITNVLRHSEAHNLWVELTRNKESVRLAIRDDGRGCGALTKGNGLNGIDSRAKEMRGALEFPLLPASGFAVSVTIPIEKGEVA
ncbi:sensor histidine kinase [Acidipila rosea]|uniref:Signal transduction histidine kinase n=1 Tax=Acidipila rosea TaxID=768535 RepID=A0A4R1L4G6_9BACT|nr:sensor histidine kinase [Acidipila rosea]TCK71863.1 signal transduction histidine kinase [Acidipila rosea]